MGSARRTSSEYRIHVDLVSVKVTLLYYANVNGRIAPTPRRLPPWESTVFMVKGRCRVAFHCWWCELNWTIYICAHLLRTKSSCCLHVPDFSPLVLPPKASMVFWEQLPLKSSVQNLCNLYCNLWVKWNIFTREVHYFHRVNLCFVLKIAPNKHHKCMKYLALGVHCQPRDIFVFFRERYRW